MILVLLLKGAPGATPVLLLTLAVALWLTAVELRDLRPHWTWWGWWLSLVFVTHFVGYLALRGYAFYRRRHGART